jgi:multicomponent Na+:H+ antiporter subunit E
MIIFVINLLLALAWMALNGDFSPANLIFGFVLGYAMLRLMRRNMGSSSYFVKIRQVISFLLFFTWQLVLAGLRVAYEVITPNYSMRPGIVAVPLDIKTDVEITVLANLITLTPGTLSLDVSEDCSTLYVHTMYMDDVEEFRREIKEGFERKVQEVFA